MSLERWLGDLSLERFAREHLGRAPFASPGAASEAVPLFGWDTLARVLTAPGLDALVVRRGRAESAPVPRTIDELRRLFAGELGVVVRRAERHDAALRALAEGLARDLAPALGAGEPHVQLFVTPGRSHGFGWHYDAEEVFIVQTVGQKTYHFRANTIDPDPKLGAQPDFGRILEETSPRMTCTLVAGDWLYLPRGFWHVAQAVVDSLSISIGIAPPLAGAPGAARESP